MKLTSHLFWIVSRTGHYLYARLPIFGTLRASLAIIQAENLYLMIERNDGRGVCFPGGLTWPWERAEQALKREVLEETGLRVARSAFRFRYHATDDIPVQVTVFDAEVEGSVRGSWEGVPRWLPLTEIRQRVITGQRRVVEVLGGTSGEG